jgi:hypothetical protein
MEAEHLLFRQVWYNRHWSLRSGVESSEIKIISGGEFKKLKGYHPEVSSGAIRHCLIRSLGWRFGVPSRPPLGRCSRFRDQRYGVCS